MDKAILAKILGHQLKGIMFHIDLCKQAIMLGFKKMADKHYCRTIKETKTFMTTNKYIIDNMGCIIEPEQQGRIMVPAAAAENQMREMWLSWEQETISLYNEAIKMYPESKFFKKLLSCTRKELTTF